LVFFGATRGATEKKIVIKTAQILEKQTNQLNLGKMVKTIKRRKIGSISTSQQILYPFTSPPPLVVGLTGV